MKKIIFSLSAFMLLFVGTTTVSAQVETDPELLQRAQMVSEIKMLRAENSGLKTQVSELKAQVSTYDKLNGVQEARIADLKEALKYRSDAGDISTRIDAVRLQQISDYREENTRLRDENAKLRKSRDRRSLIFGAIGLAAGKFLW